MEYRMWRKLLLMTFSEGTTYTFIIELMTWKSSWSSYNLAVFFYCQVYYLLQLLAQECLTKPWKVCVVKRKLLQLLGLDRDNEGSRGIRLWWCVAGKKPWPGWERCSRVVHMSFVHTGQEPKHLDSAGLSASFASCVAGIWPSSSRGTCIFGMQTYF